MTDDDPEDIPGDYDTIDGMKERATALGNPLMTALIKNAETRVYYDDDVDGYRIAAPEDSAADSMEMLFHFGILTGAALEREYPAPEDGGHDE